MAIRIFDVDPDAPRPGRFSEDIVGRFRSGAQVNNRPLSLEEWRVTTGDPDVAEVITELMGGDGPQEWTTNGEDTLELYTTSKTVEVILDGPDAIRTGMALWGRNNTLIHACDGETTSEGTPCPQAGKTVAERKEAAKTGYGCAPSLQVFFKLASHPDLGKFKFYSGSWKFAEEIGDAEASLERIGGPALATLTLELVEYTTKSQRAVRYTKPVLKVKRAA